MSDRGFIDVSFFFQADDGIRDGHATGVQTCALPICKVLGIGRNRGVDAVAGSFDLGIEVAGRRGQTGQIAQLLEEGEGSGRVRSEERRVGKEGRYKRPKTQERESRYRKREDQQI